MASSKKFLRTTSEILECLDMCSSEDAFSGIDDNEENCDISYNGVYMDMENNASSDSDSEHAGSEFDKRLYDPPREFLEVNDEEGSDSDDEENEWEEYNEDVHKLKEYPHTGKQQFFPPRARMRTPLDFFHLFFSLELFQLIADETNHYARQKINVKRPLQQYSVWQDWKDVTAKEVMAFHGLLIQIGLLRKISISDSFSTRKVDSREITKSVFSRKRFLQIFWALHVSPLSESNDIFEGRRSKVCQVIDYVMPRFLQYHHPGANLSADESTVPFKGHIGFKMYNPMKPTKWGLKVGYLNVGVHHQMVPKNTIKEERGTHKTKYYGIIPIGDIFAVNFSKETKSVSILIKR
ncbi:piggyBac transposable element-derived protein 4-like [Palaemon carinicauda]|uniref:piggyBac transposable element-derived protein 4-like n=1 Tax=Palaemon carinicauda TaxID=392227 RepID=UPI0035B6118C